MNFVVIPTYNERETISLLIEALFSYISDISILIVDDNSPDGTGQIVVDLKQRYEKLHLLQREGKQGIGPAYRAGFKYALEHGASTIIQMDADMSHDPAVVPKLLEHIKTCDLVLGSRYIKDGSIKNWNVIRRAISYFGNMYARFILQLPYKDLTGGFKCYSAKAARDVFEQQLSSVGYNFQIETTYYAHKLGYQIKEIPIVFTEREHGVSKFSFSIFFESFLAVLRLRFK